MPTSKTHNWRIITGGPNSKFTGTIGEVKAHVEKYAPLKRGWTGVWEPIGGGYVYRRYNSKGRFLGHHMTIVVAREVARVGAK